MIKLVAGLRCHLATHHLLLHWKHDNMTCDLNQRNAIIKDGPFRHSFSLNTQAGRKVGVRRNNKAAMGTSTLLYAIFFVLSVAITHGDSRDLHAKTAVDDLCDNLGSYYIEPDLCRSALCYDPSLPCSAAHNVSALAILATKLTVANATTTRERIKVVHSSFVAMHNSTAEDEETEVALLSCLDLYRGIMPALRWAAHSVATGQYHGTQQVLNATSFIAYSCDGMVGTIGFPPVEVLPRENDAFHYMARITSAIVASLIRD